MTIQEKLKIIQKLSGLTQIQLAQKFGVSFASFSRWYNNRAKPRENKESLINDFYLEITGEKIITGEYLNNKKKLINDKSNNHKNILEEVFSNPDIFQEFILKLTYHSNKIEGSTLTENETAAIIFDNNSISNKNIIEQIEAKNHQAALNFLFNHILQKGKIDEAFILKLHSILMNGIISNPGEYRRHAVRIIGANVPTANYLKIPILMKDLIERINKDQELILKIALTHSFFEQTHPFIDGNGRIGRLIIQAMLLESNIAPAIIREERKKLYYLYLQKSQLSDDSSQLENFICDAILDGFDILERKYY